MITCPRCGYQAPDGTPYCPRCGYGRQPVPPQPVNLPKQDNMLTCPKCGLMLPAGSQYCSRCGYKFPGKQTSEKENLSCGAILLICLCAMTAFVLIFSIGSNISTIITKPAGTPTMSANAVNAAAQKTAEVLRQSTEAPMLTKTAEYKLTPTRTPEPTVPPLCHDRQMDIIRLTNALDAKGHPYPESYNVEKNACIYRITDSDSFLGMNSFGYLTIFYSEDENPRNAIVEIYFKDNAETKELIRDWSAAALAFVDKSQTILTAYDLAYTAQSLGYAETSNYGVSASLDPDSLVYLIGIVNMEDIISSIE